MAMKLGDVLQKERLRKGLSLEETARHLGITEDEYRALESGESPIEMWGPVLGEIAIELGTPTSRLVSESGKSRDAANGQVGRLVQRHRVNKGVTVDALAEKARISREELEHIESGQSMSEEYGPLLLRFAETIEQPVFNLLYPCGISFQDLDDYP